MAAGEYVSVRSQRELFEYQIGLERDELAEYPDAEAQELALIYAAKGLPRKRGRASREEARRRSRACARHARARGARPKSRTSWARRGARRSRRSCRSPAARCCRWRRSCSCSGARALPTAIVVTAIALFVVGALLSLFTGRNAVYSGARMLVLGASREPSPSPSAGSRAFRWADLSRKPCGNAPRQVLRLC